MYLLLKPGGVAYLHTPNLEFFIERMKASNFILKQFPEHIAVRGPSQNMKFFQEAGFYPVSLLFLSHCNILKLIHPLSHLPYLGAWFGARIFIAAKKPL